MAIDKQQPGNPNKNKKSQNRYSRIIAKVFLDGYKIDPNNITFTSEDIRKAGQELNIPLPNNPPDMLYSFRYRAEFPKEIQKKAPKGLYWVILPIGRGKYRFSLVDMPFVEPSRGRAEIKLADSTPGIIIKYAFSDEQALLAKVRYNRMIDTFLGITCYSLQNHLRTTVVNMGQVETDELYVGVDKRGAHYIIPVQAKHGKDKMGIVQISQDFALCKEKFPDSLCYPVAAIHTDTDAIALLSFEMQSGVLKISKEQHYRLVPPEEVTQDDIRKYNSAPS